MRHFVIPRRWVKSAAIAGALLILALTVLNVVQVQVALDRINEQRARNIAAQQEFNASLCRALPDTAAAGAEALVDVSIEQAIQSGERADVPRIRRVGADYIERARSEALENLPQCRSPKQRPPLPPE